MQRLIFEYSPYYIMVCLMVGVGYAYVLYQANHIWSKRANQVLFLLRSTLVFLLAFLLLGPIIKLITNEYEKPSYVLLVDNSASVGAVLDSTQQNRLSSALNTTLKTMDDAGYSVVWRDLNGNPVSGIQANAVASDLSKAIQTIVNEFEGRNLAGVILVSDGIYNSGASPLYTPVRVPVYTVGIGDTTERVDLILKNMAYNKVAYQGNRFPLKAQVLLQGIDKQEIQVTVSKDGKEISSQQKIAGNRQLIDFDFLIDAADKGM
jgi:hypothetical protein